MANRGQGGGRRGRSAAPPVEGSSPAAGVFEIDTGTCELVEGGYGLRGWVLEVNGVPSSHVDLDDPARLDFEYMRWIAHLAEAQWPPADKLRILHLGGGACSLARRFAVVFPEARQVVVEIDGKLAVLVREWFDLPRAPRLRIRVGEARAVTESLVDASRDLVVRDVFAGSATPPPLTTGEFTAQVKRVLAPGGVYAVNCGDTRDAATARREAATLGAHFAHVVAIADPAVLKGRRHGNIVLAGSDLPLGTDPALARALSSGGVPAQLWGDAEVRRFALGSAPLQD